MIPRTFVPAMSASTEGPLAAPAATPRARPPPGALRGALGPPRRPRGPCRRPAPHPRRRPAARPRRRARRRCAAARALSVVPQEGHAAARRSSLSAAATVSETAFSCFPALGAGAVGSAKHARRDAVPAEEAQHDATVGSDGGSPQMEHTQRPCSARRASSRERRRQAPPPSPTPEPRRARPPERRREYRCRFYVLGCRRAPSVRDGGGVCFRGAHPAPSAGWLHACLSLRSMCRRFT